MFQKYVITMHDVMLCDQKIFLFLEYMPGGDLSVLLKKRLKECVTKHIFFQIASGCAYLHSRKIVHRDIKVSSLCLFICNTYYYLLSLQLRQVRKWSPSLTLANLSLQQSSHVWLLSTWHIP